MRNLRMSVLWAAMAVGVLWAGGCAGPALQPADVVPNMKELNQKVSDALAAAAAQGSDKQYWDVFLPYISLTDFSETEPGVWMTSLVDEKGDYIWLYVSELDQFRVNPVQVAPRIKREIAANQKALGAGERVWGEVTPIDGGHIVMYYVPVPEASQVNRPGAAHPQYLTLLVVEPEVDPDAAPVEASAAPEVAVPEAAAQPEAVAPEAK